MNRLGMARRRLGHSISVVRLAVLLASVIALFALSATPAAALSPTDCPLPGSTFQGADGDQVGPEIARCPTPTGPTGSFSDWQNRTGAVVTFDDPNALDSMFIGGNKETEPDKWAYDEDAAGVDPGKANILAAWSIVDPIASDVFLYLAFKRDAQNGNTYLTFELNQRTDTWTNSVGTEIPCRIDGDLLISYEVASGGSPPNVDIIVYEWVSDTTDAGSGCGKTGHFNLATIGAGDVQAAVNAIDITNYLSPGTYGATFATGTFGEAALNLSAIIGGSTGSPCFDFASGQMHSRSSTSIDSQLQDVLGPFSLSLANCTASGTKFHDVNANGTHDAGEPGLLGWRIYADYNENGVRDVGEPFDDTDALGNYSIADVQDLNDQYDLREELQTGWQCSFPNPCKHDITSSISNPNATGKDFGNFQPATLTIEKEIVSTTPSGQEFEFTGDVNTTGATGALGDGEKSSIQVTDFSRSYTSTETAVSGWSLTDIDCSGDDATRGATSSTGGSTATFRPQSGEHITCVFENTENGQITVRKLVQSSANPGATFAFTGDITATGANELGNNQTASASITDFTQNYTVDETQKLGWELTDITCTGDQGAADLSSGNTNSGRATFDVQPGENITCTYTNREHLPAINVVKTGPAFAYHGDTVTFSYAVTNIGDTPLFDVTVSDDKCAPVTGPVSVSNDDGDAILETPGVNGTSPEVWNFSCSMVIGPHVAGEANPFVNVATATGSDRYQRQVTDTDSHSTTLLHQAIDIEKTGLATATAGDLVTYTLVVTNPGDTSFPAGNVSVTDPVCAASAPALQSQNRGGGADPSPGSLDAGDSWVYTCSVQTAAGQTLVDNTGFVTGRDDNGRDAADNDNAQTVLTPAPIAIAGVPGTAALSKEPACVSRTFSSRVRGNQIASVRWTIDGRSVKTLTKPNKGSVFLYKVNTARYDRGRHRLVATVTFKPEANTARRVLRTAFTRCALITRRVSPRFTG